MLQSKLVSGLSLVATVLLLVMGAGVWLGTPLLALQQANVTAAWPAALAVGIGVAGAVWAVRRLALAAAGRLADSLLRCSDRQWWLALLAGGVVLRLAWMLLFPAVPASDGATYLQLAELLAAGKPYEIAGTRAYWPPGYAFFLVPWLSLPVPRALAIALANLLLYAATVSVVLRLGRLAVGERGARLASLLVALWPTLVASAGLPEKETLLVLLLPLSIWLYLRHGRSASGALPAGLVLGAAALVQPSLMLYMSVFACAELLYRSTWRGAALRLSLLLLGMAIAVAPWALRNDRLFDGKVFIASNGGDNFYRANNPLATGGYTLRGEVDLAAYREAERSAAGFDLAKAWIRSHPEQFLALVLEKQLRFLGDDSTGVYASLRRGGGAGSHTYLAWKAVANAFWYAAWLIMLLGWWRRRGLPASPALTMLTLGYAYFFVLHSVFESNGKYHVPAVALLAILVAALAAPERTEPITRQAPV